MRAKRPPITASRANSGCLSDSSLSESPCHFCVNGAFDVVGRNEKSGAKFRVAIVPKILSDDAEFKILARPPADADIQACITRDRARRERIDVGNRGVQFEIPGQVIIGTQLELMM